MPEAVRALIVILVLAGIVFFFAKKAFCEQGETYRDFVRRRNQWLAITARSLPVIQFLDIS